MKQKDLIAHLDRKAIREAIARAESRCRGEIRVHIEPRLRGRDINDVGARTFERLGMTKTALRTGVLLFIAAEDQKFIILGDRGINDVVPPGFWDAIASSLHEQFASGNFTDGIVDAIERAGEQLAAHFPGDRQDINELANDVSIGD